MNDYCILAKTDLFLLINIYEEVYLIDRISNKKIYLEEFYGDPNCGLISNDNTFCFIGGSEKCILYKNKKLINIQDQRLIPAFDVKQKSRSIINVLTDPWSEKSAIWQFDVENYSISKIQDFTDYHNRLYTEDIIW